MLRIRRTASELTPTRREVPFVETPDQDQALDDRQREIGEALESPPAEEGGYVEGESVPDPEPENAEPEEDLGEPDTSEASEPVPEPDEELGADVVSLADYSRRTLETPEVSEDVEPVEDQDYVSAGVLLDGSIAREVEADEDRAREGLREMIAEDRLPGFEDQARLGLIRLTTMACESHRLLSRHGVETTVEAIEVIIPELAAEFLPGSAAATWERLLEAFREEPATRSPRMQTAYSEPVDAIKRLATVDSECFKRLTRLALFEPDQDSLTATAKSIYYELRRRGVRHEPKHFSDYVWQAVHDVLPGYPGAEWHESWASEIRVEVMRRIQAKHGDSPHEVPRVSEALEEMAAAEGRGDRRGYRVAARRAWQS